MNIFTELKKDHKKVKTLCKQIEKAEDSGGKRKMKLFLELADLLSRHTFAEEETFYDRLKPEGDKAKKLALEGYEEHHVADLIVNELKHLPVEDEQWTAKFTVLKENLEHHIEEEEEEMFALARKKFDRKELLAIGKQFKALEQPGEREEKRGGFHPKPAPMGIRA